MDRTPVTEARSNLSDVLTRVRLLQKMVLLTSRERALAAIVPVELAEAAEAAGGPRAAAAFLRAAVSRRTLDP